MPVLTGAGHGCMMGRSRFALGVLLPMRRTLPWLLGLCCWIAAGYAQEPMGVVASPFRSLCKTRALLDAADLRVLLPLGYAVRPEAGALAG